LKLYNTLTRHVCILAPEDNKVRIYLCGVTVYDDSHIGHARTVIVFDILHRYLKFKGHDVQFIQNFTDIDDKIIDRARREHLGVKKLTEKYIENYFVDFDSLNILRADVYPKATEHIQDIIQLIERLIRKGSAYTSVNGVYFSVRSFEGYGKLSQKSIQDLESGARIEIDPSKRDPLDFALWKFYSDDNVWESPWGKGRPGWHIECSAMALKYLGNSFELHGGGGDLVFPHHENEIAESESATGMQFSKLWIHTGMVTVNGHKMSKSLHNIITIEDATNRWGPNAVKLYCISVQYSKPLDYAEDVLLEYAYKWRQIETCAYELQFAIGRHGQIQSIKKLCKESMEMVESAMDDDLNTPVALQVLMKFVTELNRYAAQEMLTSDMSKSALITFNDLMYVFGLKISEPPAVEKKAIEALIRKRDILRKEKRFGESDTIRKDLLKDYSVELLDHKNRTIWKKVENARIAEKLI
jgi:cysteinyl-tRNA synthetase